MKVSEMAALLCSKCDELEEDAEILVEVEGWLHEFDIEDTEATFDGFDTAYPEGLKIVIRKE